MELCAELDAAPPDLDPEDDLTVLQSPDEVFPTRWGWITYEEWCGRVAAELFRAGRVAWIRRNGGGRCAVNCPPLSI